MSKQAATEEACELVLCEDPKTGKLVAHPKGKCPAGWAERIAEKVENEGFTIRKAKVTIEEDE